MVYKGVSKEPMQFYGGSAAQSSLIPFLDLGLGVTHDSSKSQDFLLAMREYMPLKHREFLVYMKQVSCIRKFVIDGMKRHGIEIGQDTTLLTAAEETLSSLSSIVPSFAKFAAPKDSAEKIIWIQLRDAYDQCIEHLKAFRTTHISLVTEYIMSQQKKSSMEKTATTGENNAGGKGTGGTELMGFLKPIRDNLSESLLSSPTPKPVVVDKAPYIKDNADLGDIDVYSQWGPLERERYGW